MIRATRHRRLLPLLIAAAVGAIAAAGPDGYERRLEMPTAGDAFWHPLSIHADLHTGEVFVCDRNNNRLAIFDARGMFRYQIPGGEMFQTPFDVAVDPQGYLYLLALQDGLRTILLLDFDGRRLGTVRLTGFPGGAATPEPVSLALSPDGDRLFVLDQANLRLWIAGVDGRLHDSVDLAEGLDEQDALEQLLGHVDVYGGTVLVALPMEGRVRLYDLDGRQRGGIGLKGTSPCQTAFPVAAALDVDGNVVVLDKQRNVGMVWKPDGNACLRQFSGIGSSPGRFYQPADLALDPAGRVYVSQGFDNRVQVFAGFAGAPGPSRDEAPSPEEARP